MPDSSHSPDRSTEAHGPAGRDELLRTLSADGALAVRVLVAPDLVGEAATRHETSPTATSALGRALMGAVLIGSGTKDDQTLQLQFRGDGPLGTLMVVADHAGRVRGFAANGRTEIPPRNGQLDVGAGVGQGVLTVVRYHPSWREPYTGIVPIQTGEVASDLAHYLAESEQKPSALALGVFLDRDGRVAFAGGFLAQALPDADPDTVATVEENVRALAPVTDLLRQGASADDIVDRLLAGIGSGERDRSVPAFSCSCSRERVRQTMTLLGEAELRELRARGESLETICRFCAERYEITPDELGALVPDA